MLTPTQDWLRARAAASPNALALIIEEDRWSYGELDYLTDQTAVWLESLSLPENGRVAVLLPNGLPYVRLIFACARLGLTLVPLNTRLSAEEIEWQLGFTEAELLIADRDLHFDGVRTVSPEASRSKEGEVGGNHRGLPQQGFQSIVFTSGTTGRPKAVPITFDQLYASAMGSAARLGLHNNDLWLSCLPLYHVGGLSVIFRSCLYGTAVDLHPRFDLDQINHALDTKPMTLASFVPTMLYRLLDSRESWPDSLRLVLMGGAATRPDLIQRADEQGLRLAITYGMTETASQLATMMPDEVLQKPGSVGKPLLFSEVQVMQKNWRPCPPNEYGEIWVKGPTLMQGYLNNPAANTERLVGEWFRTGDIGYLDEDGDLWIVQRRSDLIISGGENVYPAEVEDALRMHPAVEEIVVVGIPDPEWGQKVAGMVVLNGKLTEDELIEFGREHLAGYKLPRLIQFVDALPQTASGKIARQTVVDQLMK